MIIRPGSYLLSWILAIIALGFSSTLLGQKLQIDSVKANYIEGFIDFIRINDSNPPIDSRIAVIGDKEVAKYLTDLVNENTLNQYQVDAISARRIGDFDLEIYPIVFVGAGNRAIWPQLFETNKTCSSLIIGEESGFLRAGGGITFVVNKNRIQFRTSQANIEARNLYISSKLLELAVD